MNFIDFSKAWKDYKKRILEEEAKKAALINHKTDWGMLEELIQEVNNNPGLSVSVTLADGTKLDLKTVKENKKVNPLFTEAAFEEN